MILHQEWEDSWEAIANQKRTIEKPFPIKNRKDGKKILTKEIKRAKNLFWVTEFDNKKTPNEKKNVEQKRIICDENSTVKLSFIKK